MLDDQRNAPVQVWLRVQARIKDEISDKTLKKSLKNIHFSKVEGDTVYLKVTQQNGIWVRNYRKRLLRFWKAEISHIKDVVVETDSLNLDEKNNGLLHTHLFDTYIVGKENRTAVELCRMILSKQSPLFSPLYIYGSIGSGKTHLMQAMVHFSQKKHNCIYMRAESFLSEFLKSLQTKTTDQWRDKYAHVELFVLDDLPYLTGKEMTVEALLNIMDTLVLHDAQIIFSGNIPVVQLVINERLKQRLLGGLTAEIQLPGMEMTAHMIRSKTHTLGISLTEEQIQWLSRTPYTSVRAIEGMVKHIWIEATIKGKHITDDVLVTISEQASKQALTLEDILQACAHTFHMNTSELRSKIRSKDIALSRQIALYVSRKYTPKSTVEIGKFWGKNHTTVLHASQKIESLIKQDKKVCYAVNALLHTLKESGNAIID